MSAFRRLMFSSLYALCAMPGLHAQISMATLGGTVRDSTGAVIPNASVGWNVSW